LFTRRNHEIGELHSTLGSDIFAVAKVKLASITASKFNIEQ